MPNNKEFVSSKSCEMQFFLSEFSESKQIDWTFNIVPENSILSYDFIIGRDDFLMICYLFLDCHLLVDWLRLWQSAIYYHSAHGEGPIRDTKIKDLLFGNSHRKKVNRMMMIDSFFRRSQLYIIESLFYKNICTFNQIM